MHTEPSVLLYGDSIFWGMNGVSGRRHEKASRVDVVIRNELGAEVEVVCEGLRGRTMFGENGWFPQRNGLDQFGPIFASHLPVDVVVFCLGTNDLNSRTNHEPEAIANALGEYEKQMQSWCDFMKYNIPEIIVVSPTNIDEQSLVAFKDVFLDSASKVDATVAMLREISETRNYTFVDMREIARSENTDGIHLSETESIKLGKHLADVIHVSLNR